MAKLKTIHPYIYPSSLPYCNKLLKNRQKFFFRGFYLGKLNMKRKNMRIQSVNYQANYNNKSSINNKANPVNFTGSDIFPRDSRLKMPSFMRKGLEKVSKFFKPITDRAAKAMERQYKLEESLVDYFNSGVGHENILYLPKNAVIKGEVAGKIVGDGNIELTHNVLKEGRIVSKQKITARFRSDVFGTAVSNEFLLFGSIKDGGKVYTRDFYGLTTSKINKGGEVYCKKISYFDPYEFEGTLYAEQCPQEILDKYPNIKLLQEGEYDKLAEEQIKLI